VVLAGTALAAWDLIGGRLVRPFDIAMRASYAYWIVCSKVTAAQPEIGDVRARRHPGWRTTDNLSRSLWGQFPRTECEHLNPNWCWDRCGGTDFRRHLSC